MAEPTEVDAAQDQAETADEWRAEAEKWKQQASDHDKAARANAGAAEKLAELEQAGQQQEDRHAEQLLAAAVEAGQETAAVREEGEKSAAEWQAEAEKWKTLSRKNEDLSKKNLAAVRRLEKLEAEGEATKETAAKTTAELQAKATDAEAKAIRYQVAQEMGVPKELMSLLAGNSKKEIEEQAEKLLITLDRNKPPEPGPDPAENEKLEKERAELAEAKQRAELAEAKALRYEIAAEMQLPAGVADLLTASTREDLTRQADALLKVVGPKPADEASTRARMPTKRLRSGALPEGTEPEPDPSDVAAAVLRRNRGY
ncbi:MAG: hypothetical protein GEV12_14285 [Micromonosporaceae bacterium]|nr:hypothetical protein [Micromonosporaceae bacterium]